MHDELLLVDIGSFFGTRIPRQQKARSTAVVDYMRTAMYDVVAIGAYEMNYGVEFLIEQINRGKFDAVCANLHIRADSSLLFDPYIVKKVAGVKIGLLGLLTDDPRKVGVFEELENVYVSNYFDAARRYLPELKAKADIVVGLAHVGLGNARKLAESVPEFDVVLVGQGGDRTPMAEKIGETIMVKAGSKSSSIGTLLLVLDDDKRVVGFDGSEHTLKKRGRTNPEVERIVRTCEDRESQRDRLLARKRFKLPQIPKREEVVAAEGYLGWQTCKVCHGKIHEEWSDHAHAKAFATLADGDRWNDPQCLPCHTTGYEILAAKDSADISPEMWNVQCEACHGMGTKHHRGGGMRVVNEDVCKRCHTPEWSPDFNFEGMLKKIDHGKDEATD